MQLGNYKRPLIWAIPILLLFTVLPMGVESFYIYLFTTAGIYTISILGVNILSGNTGLVTVGHAGFFAIGAYTTALLEVHFKTTLLTGVIAGAIVAAFIGLLLGILTLRISGSFLAISTLGFGFTVSSIIMNVGIFHGRTGISLSKPVFLGIHLGDKGYYYLILGFTTLFILLTISILRSGVGRAFRAIKNSETAAQAMGVNITFYKTLSFTISAFYAGAAGALFAHQTQYLSAETFDFWMSTFFLLAVVIGGLGSILGSAIGAFYVIFVPYLLKDSKDFSFIFMGIVLILVVVLAPEGIAGLLRKIARYLVSRKKVWFNENNTRSDNIK